MNAPGIRRLAGIAKILFVVPVLGQIGLPIRRLYTQAADGSKPGVAVLVEIGASGASNGLLGRFLHGRGQGLFRPTFFRFGRMPPFKDLRDRILGNSTLLSILLDLICHEWTPDSVNVPLIIEDGQAYCQNAGAGHFR